MLLKSLRWHSRRRICEFPDEARQRAGFEFEEAIYVLHVFQKKAQRTPKPDIETANTRYQALLQQRRKS